MKPCCGGDIQRFPSCDGMRMHGKVYIGLGFHHHDQRTFICFEEVRTGERVDVWLPAFQVDTDTGLFEPVSEMEVIAEAAR